MLSVGLKSIRGTVVLFCEPVAALLVDLCICIAWRVFVVVAAVD